MKVNLGSVSTISGLKTQGFHSSTSWIQAFQIKYSNDKMSWSTIQDKNTQGIFQFIINHKYLTDPKQKLDSQFVAVFTKTSQQFILMILYTSNRLVLQGIEYSLETTIVRQLTRSSLINQSVQFSYKLFP